MKKGNNEIKYISNRKAHFNYFIEDTFTAGLVLKGSEVKSIRDGKCNISESFVYEDNGELFIRNSQVTCSNEKMFGHEEIHDRKLLLKKGEIKRILRAISVKGYTCIPLEIIVPKNGYIKAKIGIAKGKHEYDKRNTIKERDLDRELNN